MNWKFRAEPGARATPNEPLSPAIAPLAGQTVGRSNGFHYLACDRDTPIAAAAMFVGGDAAWFGFAATDAVETAEDTVTKDARSFRNLRRLGFEVAYRRPNYLWTCHPT